MIPPLVRDEKGGMLYRRWGEGASGTVFILVHGLGAQTGRWEFFAGYLAARGYPSYAVELRGFGETAGPRGHIDSFAAYDDDIARLREIAHTEHPGARIVLAGESMGGLIVYLLAAARPGICDGLICISPAFGNTLAFRWETYLSIMMAYYFAPRRYIPLPFDSGMCTRDAAYQRVMNEHASENRAATARTLGTIARGQWAALARGHRLGMPVLFLLAGKDSIVDAGASERVFAATTAPDKALIRYPEMYHALSIDLGREKVFEDVVAWVREREKSS